MKKYIGVKIISAEPCSAADFMAQYPKKAASLINDSNRAKMGYKVVYEDGYTSWSPKEVFEKAYQTFDEKEKEAVLRVKLENGTWFIEGYIVGDDEADVILDEKEDNPALGYQERVLDEFFDLCKRIVKLKTFRHSEKFKQLPKEVQELLNKQYSVMTEYLDILHKQMEQFI